MTARLIDALVTTDALAEVFGDRSIVQTMLDVEVALARAQAHLGIIPATAAEVIAKAAKADDIDVAALIDGARRSGTSVIALVEALTARVEALDGKAAGFVHWGATSQDVADTTLVLLVRRAATVLGRDHDSLSEALADVSDRHASDVMIGRTLLQPAAPITFGLKVAGWLAALTRSYARLHAAVADASIIQFGGATGTLGSLGDRGLEASEAFAQQLGLGTDAPWHGHGDRLASVVAACGIYAGELGKMASDVALLMQAEVAEAAEPGGGSSAMPHKRNPSSCARALAAASRLPGLVSTAVGGLIREHERAVGAWQVEWPTVADSLQATGAALESMRHLAAGLSVDPVRMRANLAAAGGSIFAERVMLAAAPALGRDRARALAAEVASRARASGEPIGKIIGRTPELTAVLSAHDLESIDRPEAFLGQAEAWRSRMVAAARAAIARSR